MSVRALFFLSVVTLLMGLAAVWSWSSGQRVPTVFEGRGEPFFPSLTAGKVELAEIKIKRTDYQLALKYDGEHWRAPEHGNYPVSDALSNRLISEVASLNRLEPKTERAEFFSHLGVENPEEDGGKSSRISFNDANGTVLADVIVGNMSTSIGARAAGGSFIREAAETRAWLVEGVVVLPETLGAWIGTVMQIPATQLRRVSLYEGDTLLIDTSKPENENVYRLDFIAPALAQDSVSVNDTAIKSITRGVVSVSAIDVRTIDAIPFEPTARKVVFETFDGLRVAARVAQLDDETWVVFEVDAARGKEVDKVVETLSARVADWAFLLEENRASAFTVPMVDLIQVSGAPTPTSLPQPAGAEGPLRPDATRMP